MRRNLSLFAIAQSLILSLLAGAGIPADTIVFPNGIRLTGEIVETGSDYVSIRVAGKVVRYSRSQIREMEIDLPGGLEKARKDFEQGRFAEAARAAATLNAQRPFFRSLARQILLRSYLQTGRTSKAVQQWGGMAAESIKKAREEVSTFLANEDLWQVEQAKPALDSLKQLGLKGPAKQALDILRVFQELKAGRLKSGSPRLEERANSPDPLQGECAVFFRGYLACQENRYEPFLEGVENSASRATFAARAYGAYWSGRLYLKQKRNEDALLAFLRVGLIYNRLSALAGNALFEAARLLQTSRPDLARSFLDTILEDHQACSRFRDARDLLRQLAHR